MKKLYSYLVGIGLLLFFGFEIILLVGAGIAAGMIWIFS
jgi:hypothetical protein